MNIWHIRRFQEYFNHIHILIGSSTLQFWILKFWYQNGVHDKYPFLGSKSNRGCILRLKKIARWRYNGNTLGCIIDEYTRLFGTQETWRKKQTQRETKVFNKNPPYSFIWPYSFNWHLRVGTLLIKCVWLMVASLYPT